MTGPALSWVTQASANCLPLCIQEVASAGVIGLELHGHPVTPEAAAHALLASVGASASALEEHSQLSASGGTQEHNNEEALEHPTDATAMSAQAGGGVAAPAEAATPLGSSKPRGGRALAWYHMVGSRLCHNHTRMHLLLLLGKTAPGHAGLPSAIGIEQL
jgi:hypothetical protein